MCEFDFSDALAGGASPVDFKAYTDEKSFTPSFKIVVNWVKEDTAYQPVQRISQDNLSTREGGTGSNYDNKGLGIFQGAADALSSEINRQIRNVASIPARVIVSRYLLYRIHLKYTLIYLLLPITLLY